MRNIAGVVEDRHGIPLKHALRLDFGALDSEIPDSDDLVIAVVDGELALVPVSSLIGGGGGVGNGLNVGAGAKVFKDKVGTDLRFRTLLGSASMSVSESVNDITFSVIGSGVTGIDHGTLTGLADDDHTQYILAAGTRALTGNWAAGTFSIGLNVATPDRRLEILDAAAPQLRLTHTDGLRFTDLQAHNDATYGGLAILPAPNAASPSLNVVSFFGLTEGTGLVFLDDPTSSELWIRTTQAKDLIYNTASTNAHRLRLGFAERLLIQDSLITFFTASKYAFFQASTNTVGIPLLINLQTTGGVGADGIGAGIQWEIDDSSGSANLQAQWDVVLDDADVGTGRDSSTRFRQQVAGTLTELMRIGGGTVGGVRIQQGVAGAPLAGILLDVRGGVTFNQDASSVEFRVRGGIDTNLFVVSAVSDRVGIGTNPEFKLHTSIETSDVSAVLRIAGFERRTTGTAVNGIGGETTWFLENDAGTRIIGNSWQCIADNVSAGTEDTSFRVEVIDAGVTKEVLRIDGSFPGVLISNNATQVPDARLHVIGTGHFTSDIELDGALNHDGTTVGFYGATPVTQQTYTISNVTTDRSYDANATTVDELADTLGTLIADLRAVGLVL